MPSVDNKRIAKNTMFLYLRMIVSIAVNLYKIRLLWKVLGIDNYGIYNVVGGIVLMFAFLNNAMIASSQRFISFALGKGDKVGLQKTFSISVVVHVFLAIGILILAESIGLWFLNVRMNIPEARMYAANWVYQCSIAAFMINIVSVPYNACIVAHEHMKIYGYFGIIEVLLKLGAVLLVVVLPGDRLVVYAILILCVSGVMRLMYSLYCRYHFEECRFRKFKDKKLIRDMFSFAGWSFFGNMGFSVRDQGVNILLNMFFNVAVNAAKGISTQVCGVINGFASNFTMAINPQITKKYASGDIEGMVQLLYNGCRLSFILMSIVVVPLVVCTPTILALWLDEITPLIIGFMQLGLIMSLIDCVVSPITTSLQATGKIKKFQIVISIIMIANIPLSWLWLKLGGNPYCVMFVGIIMAIIALVARLILLHEVVNFSYSLFLRRVYLRSIPCLVVATGFAYMYYQIVTHDIIGLIIYGLCSLLTFLILIYLIGLTKVERSYISDIVKRKYYSKFFE